MGARSTGNHPTTTKADGHLLEYFRQNFGAGGGAGTGAVVNATVGVGGTLTFTVANGGTGYVQPQINIPQPSYENLEVVGVSRLGVGATTETGKNLLITQSLISNLQSAKTPISPSS